MSNVLFLGMPSHGHVNPTLGLVHELTQRGEKVHYFASEEFKIKIEAAGAIFHPTVKISTFSKRAKNRCNPAEKQG